jgi:peptidoglycan/xylan/chitin deacetylase (PgdA/CDA1 family)
MRVSAVSGLFAAALLVASTPSADARSNWPQPAAGPSASGDPEVIFTFDDGPHEDHTPVILDTLAQHHVHAIFFWTAWRVLGEKPIHERRRAAMRRAVAEGHMVGNHTVHHAHLCHVPEADAATEIDENASVFAGLTGLPMTLIRVPYGDRCKRVEGMLEARGLHHLHWDMDPLEWEPTASTVSTRDYLIDKIGHLRGRAVILMHDTKWDATKALPQVLDWIDAENERRSTTGERPIRILSFADLARENVPAPIRELVDRSTDAALAFLPDLAATLILPLAGGAPLPRHAANESTPDPTARAGQPE